MARQRPSSSREPVLPNEAAIREAADEVRAVYRELEARPIERDCRSRTECCRFRLTGRTPQLTAGEALVAAQGWRAAGRKTIAAAPATPDGACPFLADSGRCQIYRDRPFGCRTHFCAAAGGMMERHRVIDLIRRLEAVDEKLRGDGPKPLPQAVVEALERLPKRSGRR